MVVSAKNFMTKTYDNIKNSVICFFVDTYTRVLFVSLWILIIMTEKEFKVIEIPLWIHILVQTIVGLVFLLALCYNLL